MTVDRKTALYELHLSLKAKMVSFAGYQLPVQFPLGIIKETLHCRTQAGLFDVSHMGQFELSLDCASDLDTICTSPVSSLSSGRQLYTVMTNVNGGVIDDIIITRLPSRFLVVTNASCQDKDQAHFNQYLPEHCQLTHLTEQALLALQGPKANTVIEQLCPEVTKLAFLSAIETTIGNVACVVSRSGYTGEDGFEISISNRDAAAFAKQLLDFDVVKPIGLGARDILRLEAGLSLYGHELTESISPVEAGLSWLLRSQGGYLGFAELSRQLQYGAPRQKIGLRVEGKIPVRANADLVDDTGNRIGYITSGGFSPSLNQSIAIALIDQPCQLSVFFADVRGHTIRLHRTTLPFVPHRYYRSS